VPLYEYKCLKCERRTEKIEPVNGPHLKKCPHCGGKVESLISAPAIQFKGSGWYVTDYAGKSTSGGSQEKVKEKDKDDKSPASDKKESGSKDSSSKDAGSKDSGSKDFASKESSSSSSGSDKKSEKSKKK
jgi:putative FmdB family regulatory protein